jgi:hypothetical protein
VKQNMIETPTRVLKSPSAPGPTSPSIGTTSPAVTPTQPATAGRPGAPLRRGSAPAKNILLRIRLFPYVESGAQSTVLEVTNDNYLSEVLDMICKKLHLDKSLYVLRLPGTSMMIPSSRRVETLQGRTELELIRKNTLEALVAGGTGTGTPASIGTSGITISEIMLIIKSQERARSGRSLCCLLLETSPISLPTLPIKFDLVTFLALTFQEISGVAPATYFWTT